MLSNIHFRSACRNWYPQVLCIENSHLSLLHPREQAFDQGLLDGVFLGLHGLLDQGYFLFSLVNVLIELRRV